MESHSFSMGYQYVYKYPLIALVCLIDLINHHIKRILAKDTENISCAPNDKSSSEILFFNNRILSFAVV